MKKIIILLSLLSLSFTDIQESYCEGWETGYCEGWRDVKGEWAICPITPLCPLEKLNQTRYLDGYNRGFKNGRAAAND
tara:strand:+ start:356 stop:589 length:234 start_codon:yes stop_codon:yes gene_type:complete